MSDSSKASNQASSVLLDLNRDPRVLRRPNIIDTI
jgi:hypothetical protein